MTHFYPKGKNCWYDPVTRSISEFRQNKNSINFDSVTEFRVWESLLSAKPKEIEIHRQVKLLIKPASNFYAARYWRVDFALFDRGIEKKTENNFDNRYRLLIECKGYTSREFDIQLELLEFFNPAAFSRLVIVVPVNKIPSIKVEGNQTKKSKNRLDFKPVPTLPISQLSTFVKDNVRK